MISIVKSNLLRCLLLLSSFSRVFRYMYLPNDKAAVGYCQLLAPQLDCRKSIRASSKCISSASSPTLFIHPVLVLFDHQGLRYHCLIPVLNDCKRLYRWREIAAVSPHSVALWKIKICRKTHRTQRITKCAVLLLISFYYILSRKNEQQHLLTVTQLSLARLYKTTQIDQTLFIINIYCTNPPLSCPAAYFSLTRLR